MAVSSVRHIGFPPPLLGDNPLRLPVLYSDEGLLALNKPQNVVVDAHPWNSRTPSLVRALQAQIRAEKKEVSDFFGQTIRGVYHLDPTCTGVALMTTHDSANEVLKNAHGSSHLKFTFLLVVEGGHTLESPITCDLPLVSEASQSRLRVSHRKGKKASTHFKRREICGNYSIWEATTHYLRPHQIRIHAHESGLRIVGERIYDSVDVVFLSRLKRRYKTKDELEKPLYSGLYMHLEEVRVSLDAIEGGNDEALVIQALQHPHMEVLIKKLKQYESK